MSELEKLLAEALQSVEQRVTATELAQQFLLMSWRSLDAESALVLSQNLKNVAASEKVETHKYCRKYLSHLAEILSGNLDTPIWGLNKPAITPDPTNPIPWLRCVIEGGKSTKA